MNPVCRRFQDELLDRLATASAGTAVSFEAPHALECDACREAAQRMQRQASSLRALMRIPPPAELEGRVVAELYAGRRQERAASALDRLARVDVPEHLGKIVDRPVDVADVGGLPGEAHGDVVDPLSPLARARLHAPEVLRRLVEEELSHPVQARIARHLGGLERKIAPPALDARVHALLTSAQPRRHANWTRARWLGLAAAAAVVMIGWGLWRTSATSAAEHRYSFKVVEVSSISDLDPLARDLIAGVGAGMLANLMLEPAEEDGQQAGEAPPVGGSTGERRRF